LARTARWSRIWGLKVEAGLPIPKARRSSSPEPRSAKPVEGEPELGNGCLAKHVRVGNSLDVTGGAANAVAFSPDGRTLAAADADGTVVLFDVATHARVGRPLHPPYGPITAEFQSRDINSIAFSRDSRLLATAGNEGSVVVWDLTRRVPIGHPLHPGGNSVTAVAFSPDGRTLASGVDRESGAVVLTRVPDGTLLYELGGPGTSALAFSRDGKTLAAANFDGRVRLWDPRTGAARGTAWAAAGGPVLSVSFSPDGSVLATSGSDGTAALWDIGSEKQIGVPLTGPSSPPMVAFDPTGHTLASAFEDGTVLLWDVDPASWLKRACAVAARRLTQQEWNEFLPGRPYQPSCGSR
jgi:WD40 repeat protein